MNEPLEDLLEQLCSGDMAAAERVFVAYEPYLRQAVRRHLSAPFRAKFDSADIVQSIWADLLRGFREAGWRFADVDHLRGFLFVATRNRLIDRIRQHQQAVDREDPPRRRPTSTSSCRPRSRAPARSPRRTSSGNGSWPSAPPSTARSSGSGGRAFPGRDRRPDRPAPGQRPPHPPQPRPATGLRAGPPEPGAEWTSSPMTASPLAIGRGRPR